MTLNDLFVPDELSSDLVKYIQENPIGYAPFRVLRNLSTKGILSEKDQIPLVMSVFFPLALILYLIMSRVKFLLLSLVTHQSKPSENVSPDHIFVLGSLEKYRTYSLTTIASKLMDDQTDSVLLCSPSAENNRTKWENEGHTVITHRDLHSGVPLTKIPSYLFRSIQVTRNISKLSPYQTTLRQKYVAYNYTLLEYIKSESIRNLTVNGPCIHTYSPMPYLVKSTKSDKIFVYQHGIQWRNNNTIGMSTPFYTPLTYFLWGDIWINNFEGIAHPDSQIIPTGSPWHDHLAESNIEKEPEFDVLFISQSHTYVGRKGEEQHADEKQYEELVRTVIKYCRKNNIKLKVKLHPNESESWYTERGLGSFIGEFEDIDDALNQTRIAVTDLSSAFIESSVYRTPIIVTDISDIGLSSLAPVENVLFPDSVDELPTALEDALSGDLPETERSVVKTGGATERIVSVVNREC